jgi:hypothetical protein
LFHDIGDISIPLKKYLVGCRGQLGAIAIIIRIEIDIKIIINYPGFEGPVATSTRTSGTGTRR